MPRSVKIMDFGCGTGRTAELLSKVGYTNITGNDGSEDMVAISKAKGIYKNVFKFFVGKDDITEHAEANSFDMVTCTGCLVRDHFPSSCFDDFLKVLKPHGLLAVTARTKVLHTETDNGMGYVPKIKQLIEDG